MEYLPDFYGVASRLLDWTFYACVDCSLARSHWFDNFAANVDVGSDTLAASSPRVIHG
jgi:hypothetical protein